MRKESKGEGAGELEETKEKKKEKQQRLEAVVKEGRWDSRGDQQGGLSLWVQPFSLPCCLPTQTPPPPTLYHPGCPSCLFRDARASRPQTATSTPPASLATVYPSEHRANPDLLGNYEVKRELEVLSPMLGSSPPSFPILVDLCI